jgi:hypothetical protein
MPCNRRSSSPNDLSVMMRNPLRLPPKPAHLVISLIATLLLAACDTGGQLPYEGDGADQGASSFETAPVAEPDPKFNTSTTSVKPATSAAAKPTRPAQLATSSSPTLSAPAPSPADTSATATTTPPNVAAQTAKPSSSPVIDAEDQYLLTPTESQSNPGINYQQSNSKSAPVVVAFAANDPQRIDVIVRDAMPVSKATLSDPQRHQYPAASIDHKSVAYGAEGASDADVGVNVMSDRSTLISGVGLDIPIVPSGSTAGGSLSESHFSFIIPNRALYDGDWQHWKIHIDLGDAINGRSMELLPPKPQRS